MAIAGQEPKFVRALLGRLDREDLMPLCERGHGSHQAPVKALLRTTFTALPSAEAEALLNEHASLVRS